MRTVLPAERALHKRSAEVLPAHDERPAGPAAASNTSFSEVMRGLAREVDRGEAVVSFALRGNSLSGDNQGMIALQAGVYRYVESIDLVTRLVDRASGSVKTVLQNQ
jgi:hypothetical protein